MNIEPESGFSNPAIIRSTVVFPDPDGPSNVINSPAKISRETLSTARTEPNEREILFSETITGFGTESTVPTSDYLENNIH